MDLSLKKMELKQWIDSLNDMSVLDEIKGIKSKFENTKTNKKVLTIEQAFQKTKAHIESLDWDK